MLTNAASTPDAEPPAESPPLEGYRMSPLQARLWHLQAADPDAYRARCVAEVHGPLDVDALQAALHAVVDRHEILRTTFPIVAGMSTAVQVIGGAAAPTISHRDLRALAPGDAASELEAIVETAHRDPFDPGHDSPLRISLVTLALERHILIVSIASLCADAATLQLLLREIAAVYHAPLDVVETETLQYADLSEWQHELLEGADASAMREFWRDRCPARPTSLAPPRRARRPVQGFQPDCVRATLAADALAGLRELASSKEMPLSTVLLSAWFALLGRLAPGLDILLGVGADGRSYDSVKEAMGLFARFVPMAIPAGHFARFEDLLGQVHDTWIETRPWHDFFDWSSNVVPLTGEDEPFFPICFDHVSVSGVELDAATRLVPARIWTCGDRFELKLTCVERPGGVDTELHFDRGVHTAHEARHMLERFHALAGALTLANASTPLRQLSILGSMERQTILEDFSGATMAQEAFDGCVHERFERQAVATPSRTAFLSDDRQLTYAQLNDRANQLAAALRARQVGPETIVGLVVERSAAMVIGVLGILKAGGAYLPVDPASPSEHTRMMLDDARVAVVVTPEHLRDRLPEHCADAVCLDAIVDGRSTCSPAQVAGGATARTAAYVLYTSGSTGRPKGVVIEHGSLANYLAWVERTLLGTQVACLPWVTELTFDASLKQLYAPLLRGDAVRLMPKERLSDPAALFASLGNATGVGLNCVPSLWSYLLDAIEAGRAGPDAALAGLYLGGEALPPELIARTFGRFPQISLWNLYGPTEITANATAANLVPGEPVTIGRPIAGARTYLLDADLQPVPLGVAGELYVGGPGLARGYLERPALTAERFVPDPFGAQPGARLYRTGDLARHLADGRIQFLGRADDQVKIWGHRIEPGEIESALTAHDAVRQAVVVARDDRPGGGPGGLRLVAYVVPEPHRNASAAELQRFLGNTLPEYMVPAAYVFLETLPLTRHGKIDRRALPAPEWGGATPGRQVAPRTAIEEVLAAMFMSLLGVDVVGRDDSFFALGGHSLLVTQLAARVRSSFSIELPLRSFFERPTVGELAKAIDEARGRDVLPPLMAAPRDRALPLSFGQQSLWFLDQIEHGNPFYNLPGSFRLDGPLRVDVFRRAFAELIRRHEVLRTTFETVDGQPIQVVHEPAALAFAVPVVDLAGLEPEARTREVHRLTKVEAGTPFDLRRGPLMRATLLRAAPDDHLLLCTLHHIIADGWSTRLLHREMAALYDAFAEGQLSPLPPLTVQYADYSVWQREWLSGATIDKQLAYWRDRLRGAPRVLEMSADRPRPQVQTYRGAQRPFELGDELSEALRGLSRAEGVTMFMTLIAGLTVVLAQRIGQRDFLVGTVVANRNLEAIEGLVGCFVNQIPLRAELSERDTFRVLLRRTREGALAAYDHADLPFDLLVKALQLPRDLSRAPLVQIQLVMQQPASVPPLAGGLTLSAVPPPLERLHNDLEISMNDDASMHGVAHYSTALYDESTVADLLDDFCALLREAAARPESEVEALFGILEAAERDRRRARTDARLQADRQQLQQYARRG